jgi:hypothetical protein
LRFAIKKGILLNVQRQPIIRRPKSDGRCIHCREPLTETTKDHVFPRSWYPDTTPDDVQRWTAPSCESCNGHFRELEKELVVFLACCINPTKSAAQGCYERVRRTMGIGVEGLSEEEKRHREARRRKLRSEARPYSQLTAEDNKAAASAIAIAKD